MWKIFAFLSLAQLCSCNVRLSRRLFQQGLGSPALPVGVELPPDQWFDQVLDHSRPGDDRTWKQRFRVSDKYYRPGGPAFLMIGGEGPANAAWMEAGSWIKYAQDFGAMLFQLEHRFYGESHPTEDMGIKNLIYLTSEQALADIANFVTVMNTKFNLTGTKWIAFGGSYPGSLAAWVRLKYPHLIHAAVSTSGPLVARPDFPEYLEVVSTALDQTNPKCKPAIQDGLLRATRLVEHPMGWQLLGKMFKLCTPFNGTNPNDVGNLFETLVGLFEDVVQYNKDNREFEGIVTNITIETVCDVVTSSQTTSTLAGLANLNSQMLSMTNQTCLDFSYDTMIKDLQKKSWNSSAGAGGRQWMYQTCNEFGWYQSSNQKDHPFTDYYPLQFFEQQCIDIFGPKFDAKYIAAATERTNRIYGGVGIKVTNVIFVHGSFDPWHALGVTHDLSPDATAILIPGTSHCANMYPEKENDPPQLKQARITIGKKIQQWLSQKSKSPKKSNRNPQNFPSSGEVSDLASSFDDFVHAGSNSIYKFFKSLQNAVNIDP